ncbi:SNARE-binding exocyst subunit S6 [Coemansia interrupta]|uniref:SNARE-binding exocyst subunit S6 n=1 Tax=Coemansia interrupta TaxID=1126814 RepID=A0A9W8LFI1_9FUNG|nr:SNARE-binding exocyst subunit S6 [Coemansia interrupta]
MQLSDSVADAAVKQYAIERLSKLLRHPDDLVYKADDVRRKLAQEKLLIDAQLSTDVRRQFDDVQEGIELLYSTRGQINRVKTDMQQVDRLCNQAQSYLTNFDRIQKISIANRNFVRANEFYLQFSEFHEQYTLVRQMLADAQTHFDHGDFNLLRLHYFLHKLEDFRSRALGFTGVSDADSAQTLQQMFGGLDALVAEFEAFLWHVANSIYDLALRGRANVVVQLLKVVEAEEAADRAQEREREGAGLARRQSAMSSTSSAASASAAAAAALARGPRKERHVKHYRQKLLDLIQTMVTRRVDDFIANEAAGLDAITEVTGFVVDELTFVAEAVAPAFPPSYFIFDVFVDEYHRAVVKNADALSSADDIEGGAILALLRWVREYYSAMRKELSIPRDRLRPPLLDGREDQLAQEYLDIAVRKIREWVANLMRTETASFVARQDAPTMAEDGLYVTNASVFLFEIVNQNIDVVIEAQRAKLLCDLVAECNKVFQDLAKQWRDLLDAEKAKQIDTPDTVAEGLVDYTMSLANEQIRSVVQAETIRDETGDRLSRSHQERFKAELSQTMDIFMNVAEAATQTLADIVFSDLRPITSALYTVDWYQDDLLQPVIETLMDYCQDFHDHLDKYLYKRLMQDLLSRFALSYIDAVAAKVRFHKGQTSEKLNLELHRATKFFKQHMDAGAVAETLNVVRILISLIDSTPTMIFLEFFSVKKQYPDLPLQLVEDILSKRDDLEKQQLKSILESLRQKSKGDTGSSLAKQRTLFSKLKNYPPLGSTTPGRFF